MSSQPMLSLQERNSALAHRTDVLAEMANAAPLAPPSNGRADTKRHRWRSTADRVAQAKRLLIRMGKSVMSVLEAGKLSSSFPKSVFIETLDVIADGLIAGTAPPHQYLFASAVRQTGYLQRSDPLLLPWSDNRSLIRREVTRTGRRPRPNNRTCISKSPLLPRMRVPTVKSGPDG